MQTTLSSTSSKTRNICLTATDSSFHSHCYHFDTDQEKRKFENLTIFQGLIFIKITIQLFYFCLNILETDDKHILAAKELYLD